MKIAGKVFKYGDNIDTDVIIPARYLNSPSPAELAAHCMEDLDREFTTLVENGDIIVAGKNFGSGSSREHAPLAIKTAGISCIIAKSFARIFFRNSINIGLAVLQSQAAAEGIKQGARLEIDLEKGLIKDVSEGREYQAEPIPEFMQDIIKHGGLMQKIKRGLEKG